MGTVVLAVLFLAIALGSAIYAIRAQPVVSKGEFGRGPATTSRGNKYIAGGISAVFLFAFALIAVFGTLVSVGPSDVGVETSFGKTVGDLGPGLHFVWPWVGVTNWDHSVKIVSYGRDTNQSHPNHCLLVKIGGQQSACITLTFAYQVKPQASDALFKAYRGDQNRMHDYLVVRTLDNDINRRLEVFSPITAAVAGNAKAEALSPYAREIENDLRHLVGGSISIPKQALVIPYVSYDGGTQDRLNQIQTAKADTVIANQQKLTALAQAAAYKTLQHQLGSGGANVIAAQCVNQVMEPMIKRGQNPAGVQCWPGGSGSQGVITIPGGR